jgi:oligosaccharide repeat unit polymerase
MIPLLILAVLGFGLALNYFRFRDLLYPPVLHGGLWFVITVAYMLSEEAFVPLSTSMYFVIATGVFLFGLGALISTLRFQPRRLQVQFEGARYGFLGNLLFLVPLIGLPFFIYQMNELASGGATASFFRNLRTSVNTQDNPIGLAQYLVPTSILSAGIHLLLFRRTHALRCTLAVLGATVYCLFTTGRSSFLILLALLFGMLAITRQMGSRKAVLIFAACSVVIFVTVAALRDVATPNGSTFESAQASWESFRLYLLGSLPAFDRFMHTPAELGLGSHVFRTVVAVGAKLGLCNAPVSLVQDFAILPFDTNVYTVYQPYFADFSYAGMFLIQFLFGCLHGFLYRRADRGRPFYVVAFGLSLYPLCMQFFQDQYFNLLSTWVQYALGLSLFFLFVRCQPRLIRNDA